MNPDRPQPGELLPGQPQVPVVVISLAQGARRAACASKLSRLGIDFEFFDAVDGARMSHHDIAALRLTANERDFGRPLTRGEIGCVLSYINVLDRIANGPHPYVGVLEDDAEPTSSLPLVLDPGALARLPGFDLMRLFVQPERASGALCLRVGEIADHDIVVPVRRGYIAVGQIVSRVGARRLAGKLAPVYAPIDNMLYRDPKICLRVLEVRPSVVLHDPGNTDIGQERDQALLASRHSRSLRQVLGRQRFLTESYLRAWWHFVCCWGFKALFFLQRGGGAGPGRQSV